MCTRWYINQGNGLLEGSTTWSAGLPAVAPAYSQATTSKPALAFGDVTGDGFLDVALGSTLYRNLAPSTGWQTLRTFSGAVRAIADLDGDGTLDVIVQKPSLSNGLSWFLNSGGSGTFGTERFIDEGGCGLTALDLDGDGDVDLLAFVGSRSGLTAHYNDGSGGFTSQAVGGSEFVDEALDHALGDLDGDGGDGAER